MPDNDATRQLVKDALRNHFSGSLGLTCYDHPPHERGEPGEWCCRCGAHELTEPWVDHVADHVFNALRQGAAA